ncbi:unnamed protein product, partial [Ixodes pacificus]
MMSPQSSSGEAGESRHHVSRHARSLWLWEWRLAALRAPANQPALPCGTPVPPQDGGTGSLFSGCDTNLLRGCPTSSRSLF